MQAEAANDAKAKTILVVEDDLVNGLVLFDFLKAQGYRPLLARTGPDGVATFDKERPDLVICDVLLPRQNGFQVCFEIRRMPHGARTPVLLMSAVYRDQPSAEQYARNDLQAQGYLVKPFELSDLLARVRELVGAA
jgi:DNA-binding response OmpR family regulator